MSSTFKIPKKSLARQVKALMVSFEGKELSERTAYDFEKQLRTILLKYEVAMQFTVHINDTMLDIIPLTIKDDLILDGISIQINNL